MNRCDLTFYEFMIQGFNNRNCTKGGKLLRMTEFHYHFGTKEYHYCNDLQYYLEQHVLTKDFEDKGKKPY